MEKIQKISLSVGNGYDIFIGCGLLENAVKYIEKVSSAKKIAVITDDNVYGLYGEKLLASLKSAGKDAHEFVFPHGEHSKSHETLMNIYSFLAKIELTRSDLIIALGGGVVGDISGFAAATFLRGVKYVQIPTTLLAQVDSSVGGKTAVDIAEGKNLVGAFKQPALVLCDIDTLSTLTPEFFSDGMGEVVKYGMIRSKSLFELIKGGNVKEKLPEIIGECVSIKRDVVENDEFDTGERMILNFGHTLGHAIEKYYNYGGISHGNGVAIGMALITRLAEEKGLAEKGTYSRLIGCLNANSLPSSTDIPLSELYTLSLGDKKRADQTINIIVSEKVGDSKIIPMSLNQYKEFLNGR